MRTVFLVLLISLFVPLTPIATPAATPLATPVAANGCDALPAYFASIADLANANGGLALIPGTAGSIAALPADVRAEVVAKLTGLIPELNKIEPPAPAVAWQTAYIGLVTWYRDLARATDPAAWQKLINVDRRVARDLATGTFLGRATCGIDAWNRAASILP